MYLAPSASQIADIIDYNELVIKKKPQTEIWHSYRNAFIELVDISDKSKTWKLFEFNIASNTFHLLFTDVKEYIKFNNRNEYEKFFNLSLDKMIEMAALAKSKSIYIQSIDPRIMECFYDKAFDRIRITSSIKKIKTFSGIKNLQ